MFSLIVMLLLALHDVHCSHFRGGSMSWKSIGNNQVELEYRVGFKFDHTEARFDRCTPEAQRDRTTLKTSGTVKCESCIEDERARKMEWICDDYDVPEDYALGHNKLVYTVQPNLPFFVISYEQCCWGTLVSPNNRAGGTRGWKMMANVNLKPRPDGRGINSSPVPTLIPLERFYKGCQYHLRIAVTDPDDDVIRCRYAVPSKGECPKSSNTRSCGPTTDGLQIQKKDCTLYYDANKVALGYHAVNVIIEDFTRPYNRKSKALSKVSLLFLLLVEEETVVCIKPNIIAPPMCRTIRPGYPFEMVVRAQAGTPLKPISRIKTQKPRGMTASAMTPDPSNPDRQMVILSWNPTIDDIGDHPVCYSALDSDSFTSGISCTIIQVNNNPLQVDSSASTPSTINATIDVDEKWILRLNKEISRPKESAFIRLVDPESGNTVLELDVTSKKLVTFKLSTVEFTTSRETLFSDDSAQTKLFQLQLDEGVAVNSGGCRSLPAEWQVDVVAKAIPTTPRPTSPPIERFRCTSNSMYTPVPDGVEPGDKCNLLLTDKVIVPAEEAETPYKICEPGDKCFLHLTGNVIVPAGKKKTPFKPCTPGDKCLLHLADKVLVAAGEIKTPYNLCCPPAQLSSASSPCTTAIPTIPTTPPIDQCACTNHTMSTFVPDFVKHGDNCFLHVPDKVNVTVGEIYTPYKFCCLSPCSGAVVDSYLVTPPTTYIPSL